jgi:hypothetical protein
VIVKDLLIVLWPLRHHINSEKSKTGECLIRCARRLDGRPAKARRRCSLFHAVVASIALEIMESSMSNTSVRIAVALLLIATPVASFARTAGLAGSGNVPISGIPPGPANVGGLNNINIDPSGIGNASKLPPLAIPRVSVPKVPQFH